MSGSFPGWPNSEVPRNSYPMGNPQPMHNVDQWTNAPSSSPLGRHLWGTFCILLRGPGGTALVADNSDLTVCLLIDFSSFSVLLSLSPCSYFLGSPALSSCLRLCFAGHQNTHHHSLGNVWGEHIGLIVELLIWLLSCLGRCLEENYSAQMNRKCCAI